MVLHAIEISNKNMTLDSSLINAKAVRGVIRKKNVSNYKFSKRKTCSRTRQKYLKKCSATDCFCEADH
ncbi:hypothetical protein LC20_09145 [Yersinia hibernica]|uniref:Uncharacterized protein n=1 Tax=Yersinia enterocolitica LC20 TaxID=1443113 RepID=A0A7U5SSS3_YEREN|nr:hypothetical protein LC20_09145 [Yersinia hibernica]